MLTISVLCEASDVASVAQVGSADARSGAWTGAWALMTAQTSLTPDNKLSITPQHGDVHVSMFGETHFDFTAKANGHNTAVPGNPAFNQVEVRRIDKRDVDVVEKRDGVLVATVHNKLSKDEKELTMTTEVKGKPDRITVWTRSGGVRSAVDLLAGDWFEDLSKTRLRQGLVLKIEPDGSDGVRYSGEFSYTARFDGKAYDLKNSRNDTVTLLMVDSHTVDASYRRDGQVTQKDRYVVSADGRELTVTTSGTLEDGQRLVEKLVFQRR